MNTANKIHWGIVGPGNIARAFAGGVAHSKTGELVAIATRNPQQPDLPQHFPGARIVDGYAALLEDKDVDAIYIATPHPWHAEWAIKAIRAGKHVLVEKPMALSSFEAQAIFHEAEKMGVFAGEAYMYRLHPLTAKLVELVSSGMIGDMRLIRSSFGFDIGSVEPSHRLLADALAGGGILDVGGYPVSMARLLAGASAGKPFLDPERLEAAGHIGSTGVDEWTSALLHFPNGIIAEVSCSVKLNQDNILRIVGTKGQIEVQDFWFGSGVEGGAKAIKIIKDGVHREIIVEEKNWLYSFEADAAAAAIHAGRCEFSTPGMNWLDSIGNLRTMDAWRAKIGLEYQIEKPAKRTRNLIGEVVHQGKTIAKRSIPGIAKQAVSVVLGFEFFERFADATLTLDAYFEAGGNIFDTAFVYGSGKTEAIFGHWHTSRGLNRDDIILIGKGAHSPLCYPDVIARQLEHSLEQLKTDYVDIYFMHRDNPDIPVGEFVDAMDEQIQKGRIRGIAGGSNWTRERMDAAIAYAERNGKTPPAALSNNFSLAEMVEPMWEGCITSSPQEWKTWLNRRQIPNFAWSSQARGFFLNSEGRNAEDVAEVVRCWHSPQNLARRKRAIELARKLGCKPIHIALAYVVSQPFPIIPLIGPRSVGELADSLSALNIHLMPEQITWLEGNDTP